MRGVDLNLDSHGGVEVNSPRGPETPRHGDPMTNVRRMQRRRWTLIPIRDITAERAWFLGIAGESIAGGEGTG